MNPTLTAIAATALGAGGYATYAALKPKLVYGPARTPSAEELAGARTTNGDRPVVGGALAWSDEFERISREDGAEYVRTLSGRRVRTNSPAAGYAAYDIVAELGLRANELEQLFYRSLSRDQAQRFYASLFSSGSYDLSVLSGASRSILVSTIGAWTQFSNALRILGRLYQANGMRPQDRPARWRARNIDLSRIVVRGGIAHPMALHVNANTVPGATSRSMVYAGEWRAYGVELIDRLRQAYPSIMQVPDDDQPMLEESLDYDRSMTVGAVPSDATMGAIVAPIAIWIGANLVRIGWTIAIILVGYGVSRAIQSAGSGALALAGANVPYLEAKVRAYEDALSDCGNSGIDPAARELACQRAEQLALEIEAYKPGLGWLWIGILILGGLGAGTYALWRLQAKRAMKKRRRNPVTLPTPQRPQFPPNVERHGTANAHTV